MQQHPVHLPLMTWTRNFNIHRNMFNQSTYCGILKHPLMRGSFVPHERNVKWATWKSSPRSRKYWFFSEHQDSTFCFLYISYAPPMNATEARIVCRTFQALWHWTIGCENVLLAFVYKYKCHVAHGNFPFIIYEFYRVWNSKRISFCLLWER